MRPKNGLVKLFFAYNVRQYTLILILAQISRVNVDGAAKEYYSIPSSEISSLECTNACLNDVRCLLAVKDNNYCYLKEAPVNPSACGVQSTCWQLNGFEFAN